MDLIATTRTKIINAVDSINPPSGYKIVVVDAAGKRLLDLVMEKHVLLDRKCANVVLIDSKRQTENYLDAIYIIEPDPYSVECVISDYICSPTRYGQAHVFLLGESTTATKKIQKSLQHRLSSVQVADFSVYALESRVFSFGDPYSADFLYNRNMMLDIKYLSRVSSRLYNTIAPFGHDPIIRYFNPSAKFNKSELPKILAEMLDEKFTVAQQEAAGALQPTPVRTQVLIVDRSVDQYAPILHEFTLQALAYDLLEFVDNTLASSPNGSKLDDGDSEWVALRHTHISYAIEELTRRVAELKAANPHFGNSGSGGQVKVSDIRNMMAALPDFVKSKDSMAVSLQVATDCMETVEKGKLMQVAELEQAFALHSDADGKKLGPEVADQLVAFLADPALHKDIKLRLIMVYVLSRRHGLFQQDYALLQHHAQLEGYELEMIQNLSVWGRPTVKSDSTPDYKGTEYGSDNTEEQYLYARYTPGLKNILEGLLQGQLDRRQFPVVGDSSHDVDDTASAAPNSLRNPRQRATWARPGATNAQRPKIIVFMLGGFTASERRAVYEVSAVSQRDIIIGGPDELTPAKYLRFLARQGLAREYLGLPQDQPPNRAPKHLFESSRKDKPLPSATAAHATAPEPARNMHSQVPAQSQYQADILANPNMTKEKEKEKKKLRFFKR